MKKLILSSVFCVALAVESYSQGVGLVNMSNASSAQTHTNLNNGTATGNALGAGNFYYALLISSSAPNTNGMAITVSSTGIVSASDPTAFGFTATPLVGTNSSASTGGRFTGGPATGVQVAGTLAGNTYYDIVVGWSGNLGSTWAQLEPQITSGNWVASGYFGFSVVGSFVAGGLLADGTTTQPTPQIMGSSIPSFTMYNTTVPEPATMTLAALGGASLLLFRRKK